MFFEAPQRNGIARRTQVAGGWGLGAGLGLADSSWGPKPEPEPQPPAPSPQSMYTARRLPRGRSGTDGADAAQSCIGEGG